MTFTSQQLATIKQYIVNTPDLASRTSGDGTDYAYIANALSAEATPTFYVYRTSYSPEQMRSAMTVNLGTSQLDALTVGKRDSLLWFISVPVNPSNPSVIATIEDFCGSQNTLKASLVNGAKRPATLVEKLLATGTGTLGSPATLTYEGAVRIDEIASILA